MVTFGVLGVVRVTHADGSEVVLTGHRQRRLLSALLLHRGRTVSVDRLSELVWDADTPVETAALQSLVFRLRQRLPALDLEFRAPGYLLRVDDDHVDADQFERAVLDATACRSTDPARASELIDSALALWHGQPYDDLADSDVAQAEAARLEELRCMAQEERFELSIDRGGAAEAIADLEAFVLREPLRERPRQLLMRGYEALGRRADALRVYDSYRRLLADELGVAPSPELRRRHEEMLAIDAVVLASPESTREHIPRSVLRRPASSFVGRDELVADVRELLEASRLVTLIGPGGTGKTRLATEVALRLADNGFDDAIFCDLSTASADTVLDVVIAAAGVERRADHEDVDRLVEVLRHERCCIVLDNCEHVLDQAALVAERLVESTDHVVVLATSRERLAVDGERLVIVPPLPHEGDSSAATHLLVDRMVAITGRTPDDDELALLAELAGRLDGLPLALELAAARLQTLSVREVLGGVDKSIAVLRGGRRLVDRHRSVDAALRWSYDMLDEPARAALRAAATFAAPFRAVDVAGLLSVDVAVAVDRMSDLIERSLADRHGDYLRLLHVVRTFALEQTDPAEIDELRRAHARLMGAVAVTVRADLRSAATSAPIDEYQMRIVDFRRAIDVSLDDDDPDTALGIVVALRDLAFNSSSFELQRWAQDAAVAGERVGHAAAVDAYAVASLAAWKRGSLDDMRRLLAHAEAIVGRSGGAPTYELLGAQATEDLAHGALMQAIDRLALAGGLPGVSDDHIRFAETQGTLVICKAYAHHADAVTVADSLMADVTRRPASIAHAWGHYASGECRIDDDPDLSRRHLEHAVECARAGGSSFIEGVAGASLASLDVRSGNTHAAVATYRWLVPLWLRAGLQTPFWTGMRSVAELLANSSEEASAVRILGAVMAPGVGHDVFGADAARLGSLRTRLRSRVGSAAFDDVFTAGSGMDEAAVAHEATAAFDRISAQAT